jgi:serine protease Do
MISAKPWDLNTFQAVASSISTGQSAPLDITRNGKLIEVVRKTLAYINSNEPTDKAPPSPSTEPNSGGSSGSGFVVSSSGYILTNAHVVDGCTKIFADGVPASLVDASSEFDLALLQTTLEEGKSVAVFSASPAMLNSDVTAVGFPYAGLLGGMNVTRGAISSLKGLGGNANTFQISAPVQSGNSGGPLLASDGEVVGVVVSKLDATFVAENLGDVPQNVNFAIRGEIAKLFLAQNQVEAKLSLDNGMRCADPTFHIDF